MSGAEPKRWKVGELAAATGVTVRALHHYDERALLVPAERTSAGHRVYVEEDVRRLYRIVSLRELGLSLAEISVVLDRGEPDLAELVRRQLERVEGELVRQRRLRGRLEALLQTLEGPDVADVDELIDAMEAMRVVTDVVEVARILGVSRQRASELVDSALDFPRPEGEHAGRPVWAREEVERWAASHPDRGPAWRRPATSEGPRDIAFRFTLMDLAAKHGKALDHGWIGDEHLLLALLDRDCPGAAPAALETAGLEHQRLRSAIVERVGGSYPTAANGQGLSHSTQYVLERAELKAVELRDERVSGEHALLALLEAPADSHALVLLSDEGVDRAALVQRLIAMTDSREARSDAGDAVAALPCEVHAADVARILGVARKRVGELAASDPSLPGSWIGPAGYRLWSRPAVEAWALAHPEQERQQTRLRPPAPGEVGRGTDRILAIARAEASVLNHHWVGPDHLFLALLHPDCPGETRAVLESLDLTLADARERYVQSMGDPFEAHQNEPVVPPATHIILERATRAAVELEDEEVTGTHVLLAQLSNWANNPAVRASEPAALDVDAVRERLIAHTAGMLPVPPPTPRSPHPYDSLKRIPRPPEPRLATSPAGHDPRRRRPWGSRVFEIPGKGWSPANGQYSIDRDGYAVLTVDGKPVSSMKDEEGRTILAEDGKAILTAIEIPAGSQVKVHPGST